MCVGSGLLQRAMNFLVGLVWQVVVSRKKPTGKEKQVLGVGYQADVH